MPGAVAVMQEAMQRFKVERPPRGAPWGYLRRFSTVVDELILEVYRTLHEAGEGLEMAMVAVGGFGRRELTPWSDVDLMFLCEETASLPVIRTVSQVLHTLWDLRMEVGYSVRTIEDCLEVSRRDTRTWTALMDARFLTGNRPLFDSLRERMRADLHGPNRAHFAKGLIQTVAERHRRYASAPFLVEPHVKEGPGGLRDVQCALWLARCVFPVNDLKDLVDHALISPQEAEGIEQSHGFLWTLRLELHRLAGRKEDQMTFGMQERLATELGGMREPPGHPVELFMRHFYEHIMRIRCFVEDVVQKATDPSIAGGPKGPTISPKGLGGLFLVARGRLTLLDDGVFESDPPRMMEALAYAHRKGFDLDLYTRDQIKASIHLVDEAFRGSARVKRAFFSILDTPDCGHRSLALMHRLGLLQAYLPEFDRICYRIQHDAYHAYTVDVHSLEAVGELGRIRASQASGPGELVGRVAHEQRRWVPLILATLLHDIGKGDGPGHAQRGEALASHPLRRWRLAARDRRRVLFLIREHLQLMDTALGRDLTEEKVIADFSIMVGSVDRLNELYLLTLADLKSTGPDLLTHWKQQLLDELYLKSRHLLETGELVSPDASRRIEEARALIRGELEGRMDPGGLKAWIESLPARYLLTTPREHLLEQDRMARELIDSGESLRIAHRIREAHQEIIVCTRDAPALFSTICGVFVAHGINILGARIHTWANGIAMDTFQLASLGAGERTDGEQIGRLAGDLASVLEGKTSLERLLERRAPALGLLPERHPRVQASVRVDNRSSDFHTILEVRATDRFGLLHALTRTLSGMNLDIHLALIDTRRGQVFDVFYVLETAGQKVTEPERLALLEREIHRTLETTEEWDGGDSVQVRR